MVLKSLIYKDLICLIDNTICIINGAFHGINDIRPANQSAFNSLNQTTVPPTPGLLL